MTSLPLSPRDTWRAIGAGILTAVALTLIMLLEKSAGISPFPMPVALAFADRLLGATLPLPAGLLFHAVYVTFWGYLFVRLYPARTFGNAVTLGALLALLALVVFFPFIGWGFLGLGVGPKLIVGALVAHFLFALFIWLFAKWLVSPVPETETAAPSQAV